MNTPGGQDWQRPGGRQHHEPEPPQRAGYHGYRTSSDYRGLGAFSGNDGPGGGGKAPDTRTGRRNRAPIIVAVLACLLLAGGGVITLLLVDTDSEPASASGGQVSAPSEPRGSSTSAARATADTGAATGSRTPREVEDIRVGAITPGWKGVIVPREGVVYDVPAGWRIEKPTVLTGLWDEEGEEPRVVMHGVSTAQPPTCPEANGPYQGQVGFVTVGDIEPRKAARAGAKLWADAITESQVEPPEATEVTINGGFTAQTATMRAAPTEDVDCPVDTIGVTTVAVDTGEQTALFLAFNPLGRAESISREVIDKMIASVRPAR